VCCWPPPLVGAGQLVSGRRVVAAVVRQHQKRQCFRSAALSGAARQSRSQWPGAEVEVELDSINSGIPLRDERMRKELFEIEQISRTRLITTQIDLRPINDLAPGAQLNCACR
jgi:hypothetical protein